MTSARPVPFDVFAVPLGGVSLIEASAGTGKTWNICGLYLRLLVEQELEVSRILVVTFTNAATAELRERIRARIVATLEHLRGHGSGTPDPFVEAIVTHLEARGIPAATARDRLELARRSFDEAAILTIHGFCQRALAEAPVAAGLPFALELLQDDDALLREVAQDFWRAHVAGAACEPALAAYLAQKGDSPESFKKLLRTRQGKPLAAVHWPRPTAAPAADDAALRDAYAAAATLWQGSRAAIVDALERGAATELNKNIYSAKALRECCEAWDGYVAAGDPFAHLARPDKLKLDLCRLSTLQARTNKNRNPPRHAFFGLAETLCAAREQLGSTLADARLALVRALLEEAPPVLAARKRAKRVLGYDDILKNLHEALHARDGAALAAALRARFPAALVDEFQDTDPVQFGIFRAIYAPAIPAEQDPTREPMLFLVGDPKQAIYGFRNADLHTYLAARGVARHHYTLDQNQRSTPDLIAAVNAVFGANPRAFVLAGLDFHPVRPGSKPRKALVDRSRTPRADACIWTLPEDAEGRPLERAVAMQAAVDATAGEIARLLHEARKGRITFDGAGLQAGQIAVLVRSHVQGARIRDALRALGVGSVELSQASVFATSDAEEVERVLLAVLEPSHAGLVKGALATELLGRSAAEIDATGQDEAALQGAMETFRGYRELWLAQGIGVMYRRLLREQGVGARMLARSDGERHFTNLLHLGERLHAAGEEHAAPDALLRWLHAQRTDPGVDDAAQLRLESDRDLVQIVTVHKAKGLEYPIVFCPFAWDGYVWPGRPWPCAYHGDDGVTVLDFRPTDDDSPEGRNVRERLRRESQAETVRLLYVALTRASHRAYVVAGTYCTPNRGGHASTSESGRSMLNWLVAGAAHSPETWCAGEVRVDAVTIARAWSAIAEQCRRAVTVSPLPALPGRPLPSEDPPAASLVVRTLPRPIPEPWRIGSYSALTFQATSEAAAVDHDLRSTGTTRDASPAGLPADDILAFPRGPLAGDCLHAVFENVDFADPATWRDGIARALGASAYARDAGRLAPMVQRMLRDVLATPLPGGMRLCDVPRAERLTELEFNLPAARSVAPGRPKPPTSPLGESERSAFGGISSQALNRLLEQHGYAVPRLAFADLAGYLKGFIDLVFTHAGRFYIVDWKSNHLGYAPADYGRAAVEAAMASHGYHLQHLLYALALHRYLARRLRGYGFDTHFGGVLYLFVRGVRPDWVEADGQPSGVYAHRLSAATLGALDALFRQPQRLVSA